MFKAILSTRLMMIGLLVAIGGCDRDPPAVLETEARQTTDAPATTRPAALPRVVFLGDSLTAGYGLDASEAYPAVLDEVLKQQGTPVQIVNAGVSGDTTAGGLARTDWLLKQSPTIVVLSLGGNDGLRGLKVSASEENLRQIILKCRAAGAKVLLLGMMMPSNYGPEYTEAFKAVYPKLSRELDVPLVPFLLEGVGGDPKLNLPDGIHPTAEGHKIVARNVLPKLREVLAGVK